MNALAWAIVGVVVVVVGLGALIFYGAIPRDVRKK